MTVCLAIESSLVAALIASQDPVRCAQGERALHELAGQRDYALGLLSVIRQRHLYNSATRALAGLVLKFFLKNNWDNFDQPDRRTTLDDSQKLAIRKALLQESMFEEPDKPIRTAVSMCVSLIAGFDMSSNDWPCLMPSLVQFASCSDRTALVRGSIDYLALLCSDLPHELLLDVSAQVYPVIFALLSNPATAPVIRLNALSIFSTLLDGVATSSGHEPALKRLLKGQLGGWADLLRMIIDNDASQHLSTMNGLVDETWIGFALEADAILTIGTLLQLFPTTLMPQLASLLTSIWNLLRRILPLYQAHIISLSETPSLIQQQALQNDRGSICALVVAAFDFFSELAYLSSLSIDAMIEPMLSEITNVIVAFMQITNLEDTDAVFPSLEIDDEFGETYTARIAGFELLKRFAESYQASGSLQSLKEVSRACLSSADSWKLHEVGLVALGLWISVTGDCDQDLVNGVIIPDLQSSIGSVRARAIWVAARLASSCSSISFDRGVWMLIIDCIVDALGPDASFPVRLSAAMALTSLCNNQRNDDAAMSLLTSTQLLPAAGHICRSLNSVADPEFLHLLLEAVRSVLQVNPDITDSLQDNVVPYLLNTWSSFSNDRLAVVAIADIFDVMCASSPNSLHRLQKSLLPVLLQILSNNDSTIVESGLDVLKRLSSKTHNLPGAVPIEFLEAFLPIVLDLMETSHDQLLSLSSDCLSSFVQTSACQISSMPFFDGQTATFHIMKALRRLLGDSDINDLALLNMGKLIIAVLEAFRPIFSTADLSSLVIMLAHRLLHASDPSLTHELCFVFSKLVHLYQGGAQLIGILADAGSVSLSDGSQVAVLQFVLEKWIISVEDMHTPFAKKLCLTALAQIVALQDPRLSGIFVQGYLIVNTAAPRRTRSMRAQIASAVEYSKIIVSAKIVSILIQELSLLGGISSRDPSPLEADDFASNASDGDNEDTFGEESVGASILDALDGDCTPSEDSDFAQDPLNQIVLHTFISNFLSSLLYTNSALVHQIVDALSIEDRIKFTEMGPNTAAR